MKYFNMSGNEAFYAIQNGSLNVNTVAQVLDKKLISLNVYYEDLSYTSIEQEPNSEFKVVLDLRF
jgi:hypothetical protein